MKLISKSFLSSYLTIWATVGLPGALSVPYSGQVSFSLPAGWTECVWMYCVPENLEVPLELDNHEKS